MRYQARPGEESERAFDCYGLGSPFRVLRPPELVEELRVLAENILAMTKAGEDQPMDGYQREHR
jgi:hypothetical protein